MVVRDIADDGVAERSGEREALIELFLCKGVCPKEYSYTYVRTTARTIRNRNHPFGLLLGCSRFAFWTKSMDVPRQPPRHLVVGQLRMNVIGKMCNIPGSLLQSCLYGAFLFTVMTLSFTIRNPEEYFLTRRIMDTFVDDR